VHAYVDERIEKPFDEEKSSFRWEKEYQEYTLITCTVLTNQ